MKKKNIFLVVAIVCAALSMLFSYLFAKIADNVQEPEEVTETEIIETDKEPVTETISDGGTIIKN